MNEARRQSILPSDVKATVVAVYLGISQLVVGAILFGSPTAEISDRRLALAAIVLATCLAWLSASRHRWAPITILVAATVHVACQFVALRDYSILIPLSLAIATFAVTAIRLFQSGRRRTALMAIGLTATAVSLMATEMVAPLLDPPGVTIRTEPVGKDWRDPETGLDDLMFYKLTPGIWRETAVASGDAVWEAVYTVGADRSRRVPGRPSSGPVWGCFGGSCTFGHGLNDDETIPAVLQSIFADVRVFNFAASGHGTSDAYLQLLHRLQEHPSMELCVYFMIDQHIDRVGLPLRHLALRKGYGKKPKFVLQRGELVFLGRVNETLDPAQRLYLSLLRESWILRRLSDGRLDRQNSSWAVTRRLIGEMESACTKHGCEFLVVRLPTRRSAHGSRFQEFYRAVEADGIPFVDLDEALERHVLESNQQWDAFFYDPRDSHPNALGARFFARKTAEVIKTNSDIK